MVVGENWGNKKRAFYFRKRSLSIFYHWWFNN